MPLAQQAYKVLTHFEFEVQSALAGASALQTSVTGVSQAALSAQLSILSLGRSAVGYLGLGSVTGIFVGASRSAEKFKEASLSLTSIMSGSMENLGGDVLTFQDRLLSSEQILKRISSVAREFSLSEDSLLKTTESLTPMLLRKGLAGENFEGAIDLARKFEKSAPIMGIDTFSAQGQLMRMIEGSASQQDTLFRKMLLDTTAFESVKGAASPTKAFNALSVTERFDMINKGMDTFSNNAKVAAGFAELLSNRFRRFKELLFGFNGIFKELGSTINDTIGQLIDSLYDVTNTSGRLMAAIMNEATRSALQNPDIAYATLGQASKLRGDLDNVKMLTMRIALMQAGTAATQFGMKMGLVTPILTRIDAALPGFTKALTGLLAIVRRFGTPLVILYAIFQKLFQNFRLIPIIGNVAADVLPVLAALATGFIILAVRSGRFAAGLEVFAVALSIARFAVLKILAPVLALTTIFSLISRAASLAQFQDAKELPGLLNRYGSAISRFYLQIKRFINMWFFISDQFVIAVAPLFRLSTTAEYLFWIFDKVGIALQYLGEVMSHYFAILSSAMLGLAEATVTTFNTFSKLLSGDFSGSWKSITSGPSNVGDAMAYGYKQTLKDLSVGSLEQYAAERVVTNQVTNIGKVEIRNDFKENMEPDRIAHSLMQTIIDAAKNPTQSRGRSLDSGLAGAR